METLFDIEIARRDYISAYEELSTSALSDPTWEITLVTYLYSDQQQLINLIGIAECYVEEIRTYSSPNMYLGYKHVSSSFQPQISAKEIHIKEDGNESCSGLMTGAVANDTMDPFFWKKTSYVQITNMLYSSAYETAELDPMATKEMSDSTFLGVAPGQTLINCQTESITVPVLSDDIPPDRALPFYDINRTYFKKSDIINLGTYSLENNETLFTQTNIKTSSVYFEGKIILESAVASGDFVNKGEFESLYLQKGGYLNDEAILPLEIDTNVATTGDIIDAFSFAKAPFYEWETFDITKEEFQPDSYLEMLVDSVVSSTPIPEDDVADTIVSKGELTKMVSFLIEKITSMEVCSDN